ncbi:Uncharacterised protein [Vibrio cholerae]|nr:Uncharacterised protein [Vibrio cholerae]
MLSRQYQHCPTPLRFYLHTRDADSGSPCLFDVVSPFRKNGNHN